MIFGYGSNAAHAVFRAMPVNSDTEAIAVLQIPLPADPPDAGDVVEVPVARHDIEPVLLRERGDPDVVVRNRRMRTAQCGADVRIVTRSFGIRREHHARGLDFC